MDLGRWAWFVRCLKRIAFRRYWFGAYGHILADAKHLRRQIRARRVVFQGSDIANWYRIYELFTRLIFKRRLWGACGNWLNSIKHGERLND